MERLTFVTEDGEVLFHPEDLPDDEGVTITQLAVARRFRALETIAERLANREQSEEQGLLLRLPCKVGTYVYYILGIPNETPCTIDSCVFELSDIHKIGKSLFLTREEAEAKLKEMEDASDFSE